MLFDLTFNRLGHAGLAVSLLTPALTVALPNAAHAQIYRPAPRVVVIDRTHRGWWRGRPDFVAYTGPRRGYYFAPGYGYYLPPRGFYSRRWAVGVALPAPMRRYVVVDPMIYGLRLPPAGYRWYYAGDRLVLAAVATGIIVESVLGGW